MPRPSAVPSHPDERFEAVRGWSVRRHLVAFSLALSLPILAFAGLLLWRYAALERDRLEQDAIGTARAIAAAIDRDLAGLTATLDMLSLSVHLQTRDLAAFHAQVAGLQDRQGIVTVLRDPSGQHLVNTRRPFGESLPHSVHDVDAAVLRTRRPHVTGLFVGPVARTHRFAVVMPVMRGSEVSHLLHVSLGVERLREILRRGGMPEGWRAEILDGAGRIMASSAHRDEPAGRAVTPILFESTRGQEGTWSATPPDGPEGLGVYARVPMTDWRVVIGLSRATFDAPVRRSLALMAGLGLMLLALSAGLASLFGRRVTGPLRALAWRAAVLGEGGAVEPLSTSLREANRIGRALTTSSLKVQRRTRERDNAFAALKDFTQSLELAPILIRRLDGEILHWTDGCERLYGWPRKAALGRMAQDLLGSEFPQPLSAIKADLLRDGCWEGEIRQRRMDGGEIVVASRWSLRRDEGGGPARVLEANAEITALKQTERELATREAHLRSILATVPSAMIVVDRTGAIQLFSAAAERLFGHAAAEIVGGNVAALLPALDPDASVASLVRMTADTNADAALTVTGLRKDGREFPAELYFGEAPTDGPPIFTVFIRDLTTQRRLQEDLHQAQKMEAIGQLIGGIAHDFNNLLTVIGGNVEMLQRSLRTRDQRSLAREAREAAEQGAQLTGRLLAFGRRQPLVPRAVDVGRLVTDFSALLRRTLGTTIALNTRLVGEGCVALIDVVQFQSALLNLVINARDAMPDGGQLLVEVSCAGADAARSALPRRASSGPYVVVSVQDTGGGMPDEVRRRAFDPFFTTKPVGRGTGLGLSMVYGFARQSGGRVQLDSAPGQGTTVRLFLPKVTMSPAPTEVETGPALSAASARSETVLLVEDDDRVRRITALRLKELGYAVLEAGDGPAALRVLATNGEINLLLTDVLMPGGLKGDELAEAVRARQPGVKVLFTSGHAEPAIVQRQVGDGAGWLAKPYSTEVLAQKLRSVLDAEP